MEARRKFLTLAAALLAAGLVDVAVRPALAQTPVPKNRVVMQVSDSEPAKWNLAHNNARNVQSDLGAANVEIEIVAYGPGIGMLKMDSPVANRVDEAAGQGVRFVACENTMHAQKLTKDDMLKSANYAPAGVVEIIQKQQAGWAYVRP